MTAGALAGAGISILALARDVLPDKPSHVAAVIEAVHAGPLMTRADFDRLVAAPISSARARSRARWVERAARGAALGRMLVVDVSLRGLRDTELRVCWSLHPRGRGRVAPFELLQAHCERVVLAVAQDHRASTMVWVPLTPRPGSWRLMLSIYKQRERLACDVRPNPHTTS